MRSHPQPRRRSARRVDRARANGRPPTASQEPPPPRAKRRTGRRLFAFDRGLGVRWVAGADEAGRGCLAGPLVAAAVLFDIERPRRARGARAERAQRLQAAHAEAREELYPLVMRTAAQGRRRLALRARHRRPRPAQDEPRRAARRARARRAARAACASSTASRSPDFGHEQRAIVDGDATSAAIAAASIVAKVTRDRFMHRADALHPGWEFAAHVGYSTPEHREAIQRQGVSPLHRMSFQSHGLPAARAVGRRHQNASSRWSRRDEPAARVDDHADRVEAQLGRARAVGGARAGRRAPCAGPARACARAARPRAASARRSRDAS